MTLTDSGRAGTRRGGHLAGMAVAYLGSRARISDYGRRESCLSWEAELNPSCCEACWGTMAHSLYGHCKEAGVSCLWQNEKM
jgi:hypothetical protein